MPISFQVVNLGDGGLQLTSVMRLTPNCLEGLLFTTLQSMVHEYHLGAKHTLHRMAVHLFASVMAALYTACHAYAAWMHKGLSNKRH